MPAALALNGVTCAYPGSPPVLERLDLAVARGEFCALVGANGSGKSTLLRAVFGLVPVRAGDIELFGTTRREFRDWSRVGYVPQSPRVSSDLPASVVDVVSSGLVRQSRRQGRQSRRERQSAVRDAMGATGVQDLAAARASRLSGGQLQRVFLARALVGDPDLLVLDEPTASVDNEHRRMFTETIAALHAERHAAVLLVTHALDVVESVVDRIVTLDEGRVVGDVVTGGHDTHRPGPSEVPTDALT